MKFKSLQVLRATAAILVALFHITGASRESFNVEFLSDFFDFGYTGVDIFFVISGFIITYIHYKDLTIGSSGSLCFVKKRLCRIYPMYWIIASITLGAAIIFTHGYFKFIDITITTRSVDNFIYLLKCFLLIKDRFFVAQAWTLSFELFFYLIFLAGIIAKIKTAKIIYFSWLIIILINGIFHISSNGYVLFFFSPIILEFLIGCAFAYFFLHSKIRLNLFYLTLITVVLTILSTYYYLRVACFIESKRDLPFNLILGFTVAFLIYLLLTAESENKIKSFSKIFVLLGNASYSLYLIDGSITGAGARIIGFLYKKNKLQPIPGLNNLLFIVLFIVAVLLSVLVHKKLEKPLLTFMYSCFKKKHKH